MEPIDYQGTVELKLCEKATERLSPINGILELTPLCNMNCDMCFVRLSPLEMQKQGSVRSGKEWISLAEEMCSAGEYSVASEPFNPLQRAIHSER